MAWKKHGGWDYHATADIREVWIGQGRGGQGLVFVWLHLISHRRGKRSSRQVYCVQRWLVIADLSLTIYLCLWKLLSPSATLLLSLHRQHGIQIKRPHSRNPIPLLVLKVLQFYHFAIGVVPLLVTNDASGASWVKLVLVEGVGWDLLVDGGVLFKSRQSHALQYLHLLNVLIHYPFTPFLLPLM